MTMPARIPGQSHGAAHTSAARRPPLFGSFQQSLNAGNSRPDFCLVALGLRG